MKRIALLSVIALAMLTVTACGSSAPAASQDPAAQAPAVQPASTQSSAPANGTEVDVTLADNTIHSSLTTFQVGVPYTFVITNKGNHLHNFNIAPPISVAGSLDASLAQALLVVKQDKLPIGGRTTVTFAFPDSAAGMQLEFSCLIPRHYEDGMRLPITITK
jgi:uncharacterized cupredoxin-like copper-binding protein